MTGRYKAYPEYKNSGNSFIQVIPKHWSRIIVGNVSNVIDPQPDHRAPALAKDGQGFPYIGIRDVNNDGTLNFSTARYVEEIAVIKQEKSFQIEKDDIVFCKVGTLGEPRKIKPHGRCALSATLVLIKASPKVDSQYLLYALDSSPILSQTELLATGSTRAALGIQQIRKFQIPFAPLDEQQKIANFLDHETAKIDTLITKQEKLIELLKEKRQAVISHVVTKGLNPDAPMKDSGVEWLGEVPEHWRIVKLSYFLKLLSGDGITSNQIEPEGKYPVMGGNGLRGFTTNYNCNGEYALIGRQGALCGNINLAKGKFFASEHAVVVYPYTDFNLTYLSEFLRFMNLGQYSVSAAQPGISVERINGLKIAIPPLKEQMNIGDEIKNCTDKFDTLTIKAKTMIEALKERKTALISAAVTGKIDVRNWDAQGVQG